MGEISPYEDVDGDALARLPDEWHFELLHHLALRPIGAQEIPGADLISEVGDFVENSCSDKTRLGVLGEALQGGAEAHLEPRLCRSADQDRLEEGLREIDRVTRARPFVVALSGYENPAMSRRIPAVPGGLRLTFRLGSLPQEYRRVYSSPAMLWHHLVCIMQFPFVETCSMSGCSLMSRRHSGYQTSSLAAIPCRPLRGGAGSTHLAQPCW